MTIYALYNAKGGVGKTISAVSLSCMSAREGRKTLLAAKTETRFG